MERLKTVVEKAAELEKFRKERALQKQQWKHLEQQRLLKELEKHKPYIIQLINNCTKMPVRVPWEGRIVHDLIKFLNDGGAITVNTWLRENGYNMKEYLVPVDGVGVSSVCRKTYYINIIH